MKTRRKRKCRHCKELFRPDPRNFRHQKYCPKQPCRKASKAASQHRWRNKAENRDYFRGPANVQRVQVWRQSHPQYWRHKGTLSDSALQEDSLVQAVEIQGKSDLLNGPALQDISTHQVLVLLGLIAHLTGSALQDEIAQTVRQLLKLGDDVLNSKGGQHVHQTSVMPLAGPPDSQSVQLGRSTTGSG